MKNVALVAVGIMQERKIRATVRIVLDRRHFRRDANLLAAKIHFAVLFLVATAAMPNHNFAVVVPPARALLRLEQGLFRLLLGDMALVHDGDKPPRSRIWIKALQSHRCLLPSYVISFRLPWPKLQVLRVLDHFFVFRELYVRFLPIAPVAFVLSATAHFADIIRGTHRRDFYLKNLL